MIWEPFALALVFGLMVSAALYFIFLWPAREPRELPSHHAQRQDAQPRDARAATDQVGHSTDQSLADKP